MITFPTKRPHCPVCGKKCRIVESFQTSSCHDGGEYNTQTVVIRCAHDGFFEMMKAMHG